MNGATNAAVPVSIVHFGKLPSRGDFVRSAHRAALTRALDRWLTRGVESMADDPRWKETYDRAPALRFAFVGSRSRPVLTGHLVASADSAGRRFPFVVAAAFEPNTPAEDAPLAFLTRSPLVLDGLGARCESASTAIRRAADPAVALADTRLDIDPSPALVQPAYDEFLTARTIGDLEAALRRSGHASDLRRTWLALGLLLRPLPASGRHSLDKGLALPLPHDPAEQVRVATLWLDLIGRFLTRGDFELALYLPRDPDGVASRLLIGFSGGAPTGLQAALDPEFGRRVYVDLTTAGSTRWVEADIGRDPALKKLSSYLGQPRLSLHQARATFGEAFSEN